MEHIWNTIKLAIYGFLVYLDIDIMIAEVLSYLIMIDTGIGIINSFKIPEYKFSTRKLFKGISSKLVLIILPLTILLVGKGLDYDFSMLSESFLKLLVLSEGISIITKVQEFISDKPVEKKDYIHRIIKTIRIKLEALFDKVMDVIDRL